MPMVPGLSTNMPSRINPDDDWSINFSDPYFTLEPVLGEEFSLANVDLLNLPENIFDEEDIAAAEQLFPHGLLKRDCLFGKPEDQCLNECGAECDPFNRNTTKYCSISTNMLATGHACTNTEEFLLMVNPQSVLPQQLCHPYSPLNDHCYYQTVGYPDSEVKESGFSYESESPSEDSGEKFVKHFDMADEIVDVETVQDKVEPPVKVVKKRGRKPGPKFKFINTKTVSLNNRRTAVMKRSGKTVQPPRVAKGRRQGKTSCEPSSASSSDAEEHGRRSNHNNMERHRRDEQKRMLQGLRVMIPSIKNNPKAPKVMILNEAAKYCTQLKNQGVLYEQVEIEETQRRKSLRKRLDQLKKIKLERQ